MSLKKFLNIKEPSQTERILAIVLSILFLAIAIFFCCLVVEYNTLADLSFVDPEPTSDTDVLSI